MANSTWRLLLHSTNGALVTYTLSEHVWEGPTRRTHGIELMSTCRPHELHAVLDEVADYVLHRPPFGQDPLPL
jgi:hypothetical protein